VQLRWFLTRRLERFFDVLFPVVLQQFRMLVGSTCTAITSGDSRAANWIPWQVILLQRSIAITANRMLAQTSHIHGILATGKQFHRVIVAAHKHEASNREWNEKQRNPGAFYELRHQHTRW